MAGLPRGLRAISTPAIRRAAMAPELERLLSSGSVDLLLTDQVQAIQVRGRKGLEVLSRRASEARRLARRKAGLVAAAALAGSLTLLLHVLTGREAGARGVPGGEAALWILAGVILLAILACGISLARLVRDMASLAALARLASSHAAALEGARTAAEALAIMESALDGARRAGAAPPISPAGP